MLADLAKHPDRVQRVWEAMTFDEQRALLVALIEHVEVDPPHRRQANTFEPARIHEPAWKTHS
jgi:hypothetical protein